MLHLRGEELSVRVKGREGLPRRQCDARSRTECRRPALLHSRGVQISRTGLSPGILIQSLEPRAATREETRNTLIR